MRESGAADDEAADDETAADAAADVVRRITGSGAAGAGGCAMDGGFRLRVGSGARELEGEKAQFLVNERTRAKKPRKTTRDAARVRTMRRMCVRCSAAHHSVGSE